MLFKKGDASSEVALPKNLTKLPLNIPLDSAEEEEDSGNDINNLTELVSHLCLDKEESHLSLGFNKLEIRDDSSDEDSVKETLQDQPLTSDSEDKGSRGSDLEDEVVSKGPENRKSFISSNAFSPYYIPSQSVHSTFTGYSYPPVTHVSPHLPHAETLVPQYGIGVSPELVREESRKQEPEDIYDFLKSLSEPETANLFDQIMSLQKSSSSPTSDASELFPPTPESGYETMSPSSPPNRRSEGHTPDYLRMDYNLSERPTTSTKYAPCPPPRGIMPECVAVNDSAMKESAAGRLKKKGVLDISYKGVEWVRICRTEKDFFSIDDQGFTKLMKNLQDVDHPKFMENIYVRTSVIKTEKYLKLLVHRNNQGHSALYMAALQLNKRPIVARLIADTLVHLGAKPDEVVDKCENTLLHLLAQQGDSHAEVLAELLNTPLSENPFCPAFSVNQSNLAAQTPLHVAALNHSPPNKSYIAIVRLLLKYKADIANQNGECMTPLHIAAKNYCDPVMIRALTQTLSIKNAINLTDKQGKTALHYASSFPNAPLEKQNEVINLLRMSGAASNIHNLQGKVPTNHIDSSRKEVVKQALIRKVF